jgi:hypothetical protein
MLLNDYVLGDNNVSKMMMFLVIIMLVKTDDGLGDDNNVIQMMMVLVIIMLVK